MVRVALAGLVGAVALAACGDESATPSDTPSVTPSAPPNILWIVWDTVRARDMSLYGHARSTTPHLDDWARGAVVFENAVSAAPTTVPAHASMFTGLLPFQHGADNQHDHLAREFDTIAEILGEAGYASYLFSANPYLRVETGLAQGFAVVEHPWSPEFRSEASRIAREKTRPYARHGVSAALVRSLTHPKSAGALARAGLERWLASRPADAPFFAFLNYMEAHDPVVPFRRHREPLMTPKQIAASYSHPLAGMAIWNYTARVTELSRARLEITRLTYDAAIAELDEHFARLIESLERSGNLANTAVIVTSDHGELLGEHHMLNHQFSVHQELLRVPLVLSLPGRLAPRRDPRPVMNLDVFPTLIELAGVSRAQPARMVGVSLLSPREDRPRLSEYPSAFEVMEYVKLGHPNFDDAPFLRSLRAFFRGRFKYVWASDGSHALYDLRDDPAEERDIAASRSELAAELDLELSHYLAGLGAAAERGKATDPSAEMKAMLESLGYTTPEPR